MYPKMLYRGSFATEEDLHAAWNDQRGIEQKTVHTTQEEAAALKIGFVDVPSDMVKMPAAASMIPPKKSPKDEPLSGNG